MAQLVGSEWGREFSERLCLKVLVGEGNRAASSVKLLQDFKGCAGFAIYRACGELLAVEVDLETDRICHRIG